jgi:hypothetical protein
MRRLPALSEFDTDVAQLARSTIRCSIVVAARNEQTRVAHTVRRLLAQTHVEVELIVINDPSTDRTGEILASGSVYVAAASDGDYSQDTIFDFVTVKYVVSEPSLFITRSNASVILSWPASALSFQLQESASLTLSNDWSVVAAPRSTNNNLISVTLPAAGACKFFHLSSP